MPPPDRQSAKSGIVAPVSTIPTPPPGGRWSIVRWFIRPGGGGRGYGGASIAALIAAASSPSGGAGKRHDRA